MKIAWLVWDSWEEKQLGLIPKFMTREPESWQTFIRIVYCEVVE